VLDRIREDWRSDRARFAWFLVHGAALAILMGFTLGRGTVFVIVGVIITVSYGAGYVVLTCRALRRDSSSSSERQK
jgi:hypothetical protein